MSKFIEQTLEQYLKNLSSEDSVPGGGSVSAYVAALAMGLSQMVIRVTLKRKAKADWTDDQKQEDQKKREALQGILEALEKAKNEAFLIVDKDPQVYQEVMDSYKDATKLEETLLKSFQLQADLATLVVSAQEWNEGLNDLIKGSIKNDLLVSAGLLQGAFRGAYSTAHINVVYMKNEKNKAQAEKTLEDLKLRFKKGSGVHVGE